MTIGRISDPFNKYLIQKLYRETSERLAARVTSKGGSLRRVRIQNRVGRCLK